MELKELWKYHKDEILIGIFIVILVILFMIISPKPSTLETIKKDGIKNIVMTIWNGTG